MKFPIALAALLPALASAAEAPTTNLQECIDPADYPADTDFFPDKFVPHETTDLITVSYHSTYKIVTNVHKGKSYLLYQCGTTPPADEEGKHHLTLSVPHTGGVAVTETPQIAPLELLAKRTDIKGYIGNPMLVSSPCLNHLMSNPEDSGLTTVHYPEDPYNSTLRDQGAAAFLAENPETIVFAGPYGNVDGDMHMGVSASQERTAVATFDWLGMFAALFNLEGEANTIIADTEARYDCSAANAATLTSDRPQEEKPKILWAQYFSSVGGWSVATCPTWDAAYNCEFAQHCGANLVSRPADVGFNQPYGGTDYWYLTDEEFLKLGKDVPSWIYPSKTFDAVYESKTELLSQFKSVQLGNVYDTQGQGPHGWHEQRLAEYDVVALDFCTLVGTNNPDAVHRRRWFRKINDVNEPIGAPGTCDVENEMEAAYIPSQAECTPIEVRAPVVLPDIEEPVPVVLPEVEEPVAETLPEVKDPMAETLPEVEEPVPDTLPEVLEDKTTVDVTTSSAEEESSAAVSAMSAVAFAAGITAMIMV